ncbi:uncharacterized protein LOC62_07G009763 [Vanrija pseudolonga]|uniref:Uncharacterized protein n=1 Tax=Vanrija pseudolonga TaxID=143232 RepID=A0AAF0YIG7_9TREE|nr:hypothetical protein LOC62_07G009763 [Vanrija pseudolonga]
MYGGPGYGQPQQPQGWGQAPPVPPGRPDAFHQQQGYAAPQQQYPPQQQQQQYHQQYPQHHQQPYQQPYPQQGGHQPYQQPYQHGGYQQPPPAQGYAPPPQHHAPTHPQQHFTAPPAQFSAPPQQLRLPHAFTLPTLAHVHPPVGHYERFIAKTSTTLCFKDDMVTKHINDLTVRDAYGDVFFQLPSRGNTGFINGKPNDRLTDAHGAIIFRIDNKEQLHKKQYVGSDPNGVEVFRAATVPVAIKGPRYKVTFTNKFTGQKSSITVDGKIGDTWKDQRCDFLLPDKTVIATLLRKGSGAKRLVEEVGDWTTNHDATYSVTVAPGVDLAFMAAVSIALNQIRKERRAWGSWARAWGCYRRLDFSCYIVLVHNYYSWRRRTISGICGPTSSSPSTAGRCTNSHLRRIFGLDGSISKR